MHAPLRTMLVPGGAPGSWELGRGGVVYFLETRLGARVERWPITGESVSVGRGRENDLIVNHETISRSHVVIHLGTDGVRVEDLHSTNGLFVAGERVADAELGYDDWFVAGGVMMTVHKGIGLTSWGQTPSSLPRPRIDTVSGERSTRRCPTSGEEAGNAVGEAAAARLGKLAEGLGRARSLEATLQTLMDHLVKTFPLEGAALLAPIGSGWAVEALAGEPMPEEVERTILLAGDPLREGAWPVGESRVLSVPVPGGEEMWLLLYPWAAGAERPPELPLVAALCARLLETRSENSPREALPREVSKGTARGPALSRPATLGRWEFIAISRRSHALLEEVDALAGTMLPLLVQGESGTGKELLVRRIHALSPRSGGPFVALNCAALPSELLEAELFGIERGVATGVDARPGRFRAASGGTLFLDEIGDLPRMLQPKLLRALETGTVHPLGAPTPIPVDVRLVSATHQELSSAVGEGDFRRDLYHRLAGAVVTVAPLRQRREEILALARSFLRLAAREQGKLCLGFDLGFARALVGYSWPGNVRELQHVLSRAVALSRNGILHADLLSPELREGTNEECAELYLGLDEEFRAARLAFERLYFSQLLERHGSNLSEAARRAGLTRSHLYNKLDELGLR